MMRRELRSGHLQMGAPGCARAETTFYTVYGTPSPFLHKC